MLQNLGSQTKKILWIFICGCLAKSTLPDAWNIAFVYPVSKPKPWEYDLNNTRPITLLECSRKAIIKLINNRLLKILSEHQALKGYNFAGLPHRSTKDPIFILDHIKNDAQFNRNQLWILFQDMSKAYDRVNFGMLYKALLRLKLPDDFIELISSLFVF